MLKQLLGQIKKQSEGYEITVHIHIDQMDGYEYLTQFLDNNNFKYLTFRYEHRGKPGYWKIINNAYFILKKLKIKFDYVIQIPDDIQIVDNFFKKAIEIFESIPDKYRSCLNLLSDLTRKHPMWTPIYSKLLILPKGNVFRTGWVDMCYIANRYFFDILDWRINPISEDWASDPQRSSGVGKQISERVFRNGTYFYQVETSMVFHGNHDSVMHPVHRKTTPLITNYNMNDIYCGIATMPERLLSLEDTVNSILPQVGKLFVYLNRYEKVPDFLKHPKIKTFLGSKASGDIGDIGKFFNVENVKGYFFSIDDDLIYPPDYVARYIAAIELHGRKAAITTHGRNFAKMPTHSYYHGHSESFRCLGDQPKDAIVHVGGTGVMAFHTDTLKLSVDDFEASNMADIWFAKVCNEQGVKIISLAHNVNWIKESRKYDKDYTIYNFCHRNEKVQTEIINTIEWKQLT